MSLRDEILKQGQDLNIDHLEIDKDADFRGRPGTEIKFHMDTTSGRAQFECTITNDLELTAEEKATLVIRNAIHQAQNFAHDVEVEA